MKWFYKSWRYLFAQALITISLGLLLYFSLEFFPDSPSEIIQYLSLSSANFVGLLILGLFIYVTWFYLKPFQAIKHQKIHNQPSWVLYYYRGVIFAPLIVAALRSLDFRIWRSLSNITLTRSILDYGALVDLAALYMAALLVPAIGVVAYKFVPKQVIDKSQLMFAPGAVHEANDRLGFVQSAHNAADAIKKLKEYVSAVVLYGGMGQGKSSFTRMAVEALDPNDFMYTYISLTETNEAKDFSKLFSERWIQTLKFRYPKIDHISTISVLRSVLRESRHGTLALVFDFLSRQQAGIQATKAKVWDVALGYTPEYVEPDTARVFGSVPEIEEDLWLIVIDEIERSHLQEVFRVIEAIERFKIIGRKGLPVRLVFLLVTSRQDLQDLLDETPSENPSTALQIRKFFFDDPKSLTRTIFLPLVPAAKKIEYLSKKLHDLYSSFGAKPMTRQTPLNLLSDNRSAENTQNSFDFVFGLLVAESPRVIERTIAEAEFFYSGFRQQDGTPNTKQIRVSDVLLLSYAKIRYPFIVDFLVATVNEMDPEDEATRIARAWDHSSRRDNRDKPEQKNKSLTDWIAEKTLYRAPDQLKSKLENIVAYISYPYLQEIAHGGYDNKFNESYEGTLSKMANLKDALRWVAEATQPEKDKYYAIYKKHEGEGSAALKNIKDWQELDRYGNFLRNDLENTDSKISLDLAEEMYTRIASGDAPLRRYELRDTPQQQLTYEFIFQVMEGVQFANGKEQIIARATKIFRDFLQDDSIPSSRKFIVLNSFCNEERGSDITGVHGRLQESFRMMKEHDEDGVLSAIRYVFQEFDSRYVSGQQSIYTSEDNFFYVLYQWWSGKADAKEEIEIIRKIASRDLINHPQAIAHYWSRYPYKKVWEDFGDFMKDMRSSTFDHEKNRELYMTLKMLIPVTAKAGVTDKEIVDKMNWWKKQITSEEFEKKFAIQDDDRMTVKGALLRNGILKNNGLENKNPAEDPST